MRKVLINDEQLERAMKEGTKRAIKRIFEEVPIDPELGEMVETLLIMAGALTYCETSRLLGFKGGLKDE